MIVKKLALHFIQTVKDDGFTRIKLQISIRTTPKTFRPFKMNNCMFGAAIYHVICLQIAICGQLIVSCKSSCQTLNSHHAIVVRPILCVTGGTQSRGLNMVLRVGWRGARPSSGGDVTTNDKRFVA